MCGIVGAFTSNPKLYKNPLSSFFRQALFADALRGFDSTGIALMDNQTELPVVYKKALSSPDFLQLKQSRGLLADNAGWTFMLGHNRAATKGGIGDEQAHPFQYGDITLVHNGTVTNHRMLPEGQKFNVDSEAIAYTIDTIGIAEVVKKIEGAFTLVWHDRVDDSLNFIRNEERPLWIGVVDDNESLLVASEGEMLRWLAGRNGVKTTKIFQPNVGMHYKYYIGEGEKWANKPIIQELELAPKYPTYPVTYGNSYGNTNNYGKPPIRSRVLRALGIEPKHGGKENAICQVVEWKEQFNNSTVGTVYGRVWGLKNVEHDIKISSITKERYQELEGKVLEAEIETAYYLGGDGGHPVITLSPSMTKIRVLTEKEVGELAVKKLGENSLREKKSNSGEQQPNGNKKEEDNEEEPSIVTVRGHMGRYYSEGEMEALIKDGCACCTKDLFLEDVPTLGWVDFQSPVCSECWDETVH